MEPNVLLVIWVSQETLHECKKLKASLVQLEANENEHNLGAEEKVYLDSHVESAHECS